MAFLSATERVRVAVVVTGDALATASASGQFFDRIIFASKGALRPAISSTSGTPQVNTEGGERSMIFEVCDPAAFYAIKASAKNMEAWAALDEPFSARAEEATAAHATELALEALQEIVDKEEKSLHLHKCRAEVRAVHHDAEIGKAIWRSCRNLFGLSLRTDQIRRYFGDEANIYFLWMNTYNIWLVVPSVLGVAVYIHHWVTGMTILYPVFAFVSMIWGLCFVKFWDRLAERYAMNHRMLQERTAAMDSDIHDSDALVRKEYHGTKRISPITGQPEIHFDSTQRTLRQAISWLLSAVFLLGCIFVQICSLNLQGYMSHEQHAELEIPLFAQFADEGRIFDPNGDFALVPVIIHVSVILALNMVFRSIAEALTEWENYRLQDQHNNALILKRVVFEFIDCYAVLFYVAFYRLDMQQLRVEFVSLYSVDQLRRLAIETVLPFIWGRRDAVKAKAKALKGSIAHKKTDAEDGTSHAGHKNATDAPTEFDPETEPFDDYLEMVMQFGYVTLFAAAFPLAGILSLLSNYLEVRSDLFKLCFVYRRPEPRRCGNIGPWASVLRLFAYASVVNNILLIGFTSQNQMRYYFPYFYRSDGEMRTGEGRFVVATIFAIEHLLMLVVLALDWIVSSVPYDVQLCIQKRKFEHLKQAKAEAAKIATAPS